MGYIGYLGDTNNKSSKRIWILEIIQYSTLTFSGGLLGAFSIVTCDHIFANAQTSNLIGLAYALESRDFSDFFLRGLVLVLYFIGISCTVILPEYLQQRSIRWENTCLLIEAVCIGSIILIPANVSPVLYMAPVFFASSLQYNTFKSCNKVAVSTLFCTNNIRQLVVSYWDYRTSKNREDSLKIKIYIIIILSFLLGAFFCFFVIHGLNRYTPCISFFILLGNYLLLHIQNQNH